MLFLTVLNGPQAGRRIEVRGERAVLGRGWMNDASFLETDHVSGRHGEVGALLLADGGVMPKREAKARFARLQAQEALAQADGVQKRAAELLGLNPGNFSRLLKELGLR